MATIRKLRRKWQAIVRRGKIVVAKSFWKKSEASQWAYKIESQIETGSYLTIKKAERLNEIKLKELLDIFYDKTKAKAKHPKNLEYDINNLKRFPIADLYLNP